MAATLPNFLVAIDEKRSRVFVMQTPNLCAIRIDGKWRKSIPLSHEEVERHYELVVDLLAAKKFLLEAREAILGPEKPN